MTQRLHVVIQGRVQGVGFRYATCRKAQALGLKGWVRNRHDGGVEAEFEGDKVALDEMLAWCGKGPAFARVKQVEHTWLGDAPPHYDSFQVRS